MSSRNVQVCVRSRPLSKKENDQKLTKQWQCNGNTILNVDPTTSYDSFTFDHIFDENDSTQTLFETIAKPIIAKALQGINGTIFAYGQTSSGKTHTMTGCDTETGVIGLAVKEIFELIEATADRQFLLRVAYIEIYNEKIYDLFTSTDSDLKIHEKEGEAYVHSKEYICKTADLILQHFEDGSKKRRTGETNMNERSSRSHSIFRITIESRGIGHTDEDSTVQISNLNLVDLAGSERADQTGASGSRLKEGSHINRSLLSLSRVIQKLSEPETDASTFINYRDSKLTRVLQAALGGNALTVIICTVTPAVGDETYYTLCFAMRAKSVRNRPKVNEVVSDKTMTKRLEKEIERLRDQLKEEKNKNSEFAVRQLMSQISERETQFIQSHAAILKADDKSRRRTWCPSSSHHLPPIFERHSTDDSSDMMPPPPPFIRPNSDFINLQGREVRSTTPTMFVLDDSAEFKSSLDFLRLEQETQQSSPDTPTRLRVQYTPEVMRNRRCSVDTPTGETLRGKYKQIVNDFKELEEFTKLEERAQVDHVHCAETLAEFNRTKILTAELLQSYQKVQNELIDAEVSLEAAEARIATLEDRVTEADEAHTQNQKAEELQAEIDKLTKSLQAQKKLTETAEILKNSSDYEFEEFKKRIKNREVELTISLERERDLNATFAEKVRSAEVRAMEAEEAKEKFHQMMRIEAVDSVGQVTRLTAEVEAMTRRIQALEKEVNEAEADRVKVIAIDSIVSGLSYTRRSKHSEVKSAIFAIKNIIRPAEGGSLDDSGCMDTSLVADDQMPRKVEALEKSVAEQKVQIESLTKEKKILEEECSSLQQEFDKLSMEAMEQIEENDRLQDIVTAVGKCVDEDDKIPLHERIAKRIEELNAKIADLQAEASKPEPTVEEKELQTSAIEDVEIQELVKTNEDLNVAVRRMGQEINTLTEQQSTSDVVTKELAALKVEHARLQAQHDQTASHLEGIKSTVTWLEQEKAQLELVIEQYKGEAAEAVEEISSLKSSLKDLERSEIANESSTLATEELTHQLEEVRTALGERERTVHELQTRITAEATTFEQLRALNEQTIQELEEKIVTMEVEFGEKMNVLQSQIREQEYTLAQKDQATLTLKERVTDLENNMNTIRHEASQREDFAERCGQLTAEIETLKTSNEEYCNLIGQLEVEKQILADTMANEVQKCEDKLKSAETEMTNLAAQLADKTDGDALQDQLLELQIENTNLKSRVIVSEDRADHAQLASTELQEKLQQKIADFEELQSKFTDITRSFEDLSGKLTELTDEKEDLMTKLSEYLTQQLEFDALKLQLEQSQSNLEKQSQQRRVVEENCNDLRSENVKLQAQINELQTDVTALKAKYQGTEKEINKRDTDILQLKQELDAKTKTAVELERQREKLVGQVRELNTERTSRIAEISALQKQFEAVTLEYKTLQEDFKRIESTSGNISEFKQKLVDAEKSAEQLRRANADLKRTNTFKIDQLQQQLDAAKESALQAAGVSNRCLQLEKALKSTRSEHELGRRELQTQTAEVERLTKQVAALQARNEKYMLELDEAKRDLDLDDLRSATKRQQKTRRQSSHDEKRRQSMWDHRDKGIQTEPTDVSCNCEAMSQQIKDMRKDLFVKNAQLCTYKKMAAINPLQNDFDEMKKTLIREEKEKNALIEEKNLLNQRLREVAVKKQSSSSATQTNSDNSPPPTGTTDSGVVLKMENQRLADDFARLQRKYEDMKRLCRIRKEEICNLKEASSIHREKENESTLSNGVSKMSNAEIENQALKKLVGEWEEKYAQLKQLYYTKSSKFTSKASKTDQNIQTVDTMAGIAQIEKSADDISTKYKYTRKLCEMRKEEIGKLQQMLKQAGIPCPSHD